MGAQVGITAICIFIQWQNLNAGKKRLDPGSELGIAFLGSAEAQFAGNDNACADLLLIAAFDSTRNYPCRVADKIG